MDKLTNSNQLIEQSKFVDTGPKLTDAVSKMASAKALSIDTEFMRERTYYPELCLIQVADGDAYWCIDTVEIEDLSPFLALCGDDSITKILHSARQDLEIFYLLMESVPMPVFDTQLAASFTGRAEQISYAGLVEDILGVTLDKSQSRTNWAARPLRPEQISYALNDVVYLESLQQKLLDELVTKGRDSWFAEDAKTLGEASVYMVAPAEAWQKVKGAGSLTPEAFQRVVLLAGWRERVAQDKNLPRSWVLKDGTLTALAESPNVDLREHHRKGVLTSNQLKRWGEELDQVLREPLPNIALPAYYGNRGLDREQKELFKKISELIKGVAAELGISSSLLANRKEMEKLARGASESSIFLGWREEIVGKAVRALT